MATYKVISDKVDGVQQGQNISEADLPNGTNFEALVVAGHLEMSAKGPEVKVHEIKKADKE